MTGPAHYREAEKLIAAVNKRMDSGAFLQTPSVQSRLLAEAQAHATLALAAATALSNLDGNIVIASDHAWLEAAGGAS